MLLPDAHATPGATRAVTIDDVCAPGFAKAARKVSAATKRHVYELYGVAPEPGACCQVDHLVPLELGGANQIENLWPQPYTPKPGAREKDVLEKFLHRAVCTGAMTLEEAQTKVSTDWYRAYQEMRWLRQGGGGP